MAVANNAKASGLSIQIDVDSPQLDTALAKAKDLVDSLAKADNFIIKVKQSKLDGSILLDGSETLSGTKVEVESAIGRNLLITYQVGNEIKTLITPKLNHDISIEEYLDGIMDYEKNYYGLRKKDGRVLFVKASNVLTVEEIG